MSIFQQSPGTLLEETVADCLHELLRVPVQVNCMICKYSGFPRIVKNHRAQADVGSFDQGVNAECRRTSGSKAGEEQPFRFQAAAGRGVVYRGGESMHCPVTRARLHDESSLAGGGNEELDVENVGYWCPPAQTASREAGECQDQSVVSTLFEFFKAGLHIPPDVLDTEIGPPVEKLSPSPRRTRADPGPVGQVL